MSDTERLIVLLEARLDQFDKAMRQAEGRGRATFEKLQSGAYKSTSAIEKRMTEAAKAMGKSLEDVFGKGREWSSRAAMNADFREFLTAKDRADALRASLDPLFAATMRLERAEAELGAALKAGAISAQEHAQAVRLAKSAYDDQVSAIGKVGKATGLAGWQIQQLGMNVQDVAVQLAAGARFTTVFAQQGSQMLSVLGPWGVALGTIAAVALPLLGAALASVTGEVRTFDDAIGSAETSIRALRDAAGVWTAGGLVDLRDKYGLVNAELVRFVDLQRQAAERQAMTDIRDAMRALAEETESWNGILENGLADLFPGIAGQVNHLAAAMRDMQSATTFEDQLAAATRLRVKLLDVTGGIGAMTAEQFAFYQKVVQSEDALRQLADAAPKAGWLAGMIGQAETLAAKLWEGVRARAALSDGATTDAAGNATEFAPGSRARSRPKRAPSGEGGVDWGGSESSGAGSGGSGGAASVIDGLIADLQTEREVVEAWYEESLAAINGATEAQLAAIGGRHEAIERLEREHQERLRGIKDDGQKTQLESYLGYGSAFLSALGSVNQKALKVSQAFAAAEAWVSTLRGAAKELEKGTFGFASAMAVIAKGAGFVAAIRGVSAGGSSTSASGGASSSGASSSNTTSSAGADTAASGPLAVLMRGIDPKALFTGQMVIDIYEAIAKEAGARGAAFVV